MFVVSLSEERERERQEVRPLLQLLLAFNKAQAHLLRSLAEEEDYWRQKARVKWFQEGDRSTKNFSHFDRNETCSALSF